MTARITTATTPVPLPAARLALLEMLQSLGIPTVPEFTVQTDTLLTLLMQASGAHVAVPQQVADHAAWLGAVAGYQPAESGAAA